MSWLSRLLTQNSSLQHRALRSQIQRQKNYRRKMALEALEDRALMANIGVVYTPGPNTLAITADVFHNSFRIFENPITAAVNPGGVTVTPNNFVTAVNGTPVPFVTTGPVQQITITLPGPAPATGNVDKIIIQGAGKTAMTTVQNISITATDPLTSIGLLVDSVDNTGAFTLNTAGILSGPGATPAQWGIPTSLTAPASITNSSFGSMTINQTATSPLGLASLTLGNDSTAAAGVAVSEGAANGDSIVLNTGNTFGVTNLSQGNGNNDVVTVASSSRVRNLTVTQGNGNNDNIGITNLVVSGIFDFGVRTVQGNGNTDTTSINGVTVLGFQNGQIPNNPSGSSTLASISVTQGNGNNDTATVARAVIPGNITILQGAGNSDVVNVFGDVAGTSFFNGIYNVDIGGELVVVQGNGYNDTTTLDSTTTSGRIINRFNDVTITQGNSTPGGPLVPSGFVGPYLGDVINFNDTNVTSNITITQGTAAAFGNYDINIGTTSAVTAGGITTITQHGGFNVITLGGASAPGAATDFLTFYLDIVMSVAGDVLTGGSYITYQNTTVLIGSFLGNPFVIDGAGIDNVAVDFGGNSGVTASGNFFTF